MNRIVKLISVCLATVAVAFGVTAQEYKSYSFINPTVTQIQLVPSVAVTITNVTSINPAGERSYGTNIANQFRWKTTASKQYIAVATNITEVHSLTNATIAVTNNSFNVFSDVPLWSADYYQPGGVITSSNIIGTILIGSTNNSTASNACTIVFRPLYDTPNPVEVQLPATAITITYTNLSGRNFAAFPVYANQVAGATKLRVESISKPSNSGDIWFDRLKFVGFPR